MTLGRARATSVAEEPSVNGQGIGTTQGSDLITPGFRLGSRFVPPLITDDIDVARDRIFRNFLRHRFDPAPGQRTFGFRYEQLLLDATTVNGLTYETATHIEAPPLGDFYCIQYTRRGICEVEQNGERHILTPGTIYVMNPFFPIKEIFHAGYQQIIARIDRRLLERFLIDEIDRPLNKTLEFKLGSYGQQGVAQPVASYLRYICRDSVGWDSDIYSQDVSAHVGRTLLAILLNSLPNSYSDILASRHDLLPASLRKAEKFVAAHLGEAISTAAIAAAAGVSERSLYAGFRRFKMMTPMEFVKNQRLERARGILKGTDEPGLTVTQVALDCGFNHLGNFARDYRLRFGELPSKTLKMVGG